MRKLALILFVLVIVSGVAYADHGSVAEHIAATQSYLNQANDEFAAGHWQAGQDLLTQAAGELDLARGEAEPPPPSPELQLDAPPPPPPGTPSFTTNGLTIKQAVLYPVINGADVTWVPLTCDGTENLNGVGSVRVVGYASNSSSQVKTPRIRETYNQEAWYHYNTPRLEPGTTDLAIFDSVQDLTPARPDYRFRWSITGNPDAVVDCQFTASNVPARSEGFKSHRTTAGTTVQGLGITLKTYATGEPIPCGSTNSTTRIKIFLTVDTAATPPGLYDFHAHVETGGPEATGPDQDGDLVSFRWWEQGWDHVPVPVENSATAPNMVGVLAAGVTGDKVTVHFAQQTGPGQPKNETFCTFYRV